MTRQPWLLNLVLSGLCGWAGVTLSERWREAERRRLEVLKAPSAAGAVADQKLVAEAAPRAASYFEVAEKMLFSKDRNPAVAVEVAVEKPMPPLPFAYGVMNVGGGPVALLSRKGETQRGYRIGETIGDFKLVAASPQAITFEWEGKQVARRIEELRPDPKDVEASSAAAAAIPRGPAPAVATTTNVSATAANPKFGRDLSADSKYCALDDDSPDGSVVDGFRKVTRRTPFSTTCTWERVR
jgi:hypothetical protein